jgi:crotonobetainyl-CoA:carnitine CoA-transferase CaiB-like acyl-CoA transferase
MMLQGLKIVEMATYIAAPAAAGIMADWGAEIIKIEPRGGDPIRQFFDNAGAKDNRGNPIFDLDNRSKRSVSIDVSTPEGQALVRRLIVGADVFITNTRPQSLLRAGLDYDSLKADFPKLIYGCVTGYGMEGAERDRPGFDMAAFWARSGMAGLTTPKGQEPMPMRTAVGDHTTGRLIETSLLRTGIYCLGSDMAIQLRYGRVASTRPREQAPSPLNSFYKTQDGRWICLLMRQSGDDWQKLTQALSAPELADDPRFNSSKGRREHAPDLIHALDQAFGAVTYDYIKAALDARDLIWAPVQSPAEVVADPQAIAAGAFIDVPDGLGATFRSIATPISTDQPLQPGPVPGPGADTGTILADLGLSSDEIDQLRSKGIIN